MSDVTPMSEDVLRCDICGENIAADEFVGLVRLGPNRYVVAKIGVQVGDLFDVDVWVHGDCLHSVGTPTGEQLAIGHE